MPLLSFTSQSSKGSPAQSSSDPNRPGSKWNLLRHSVKAPRSSQSPLPEAITDQLSTEIYELIMDHLGDKPSLLACNLVCRSWAPRRKCLLLDLMVCHPVPLVAHGGFGAIACAVPDPFQGNGGIIYGTKDGIYRGIKDGSRLRLLSIHDVSQIEILPGSNLVLCLAACILLHCVPELVAAIKKGFAVQGGFEMVDLITAETQSLLDPDDPSPLDLAHKKVKPRTVFRVDTVFLVCYDKLAFYIDRRGIRPLNKVVLRWTQPVHAFALRQLYILAFCERCVEVWNIETGEMVQKIQGPYHLLNTPESGEKVLGLSLLSGEITQIVFRAHASLNS
ncbi:Sulfhydryl oxidase [Mycena venus]|uniref:Sulfhydryl oxidase n=1 Tax=Mycena venus TaxID=2733690 RepID=A0A8H6Y8H3_9AGAR|nr:Sulfhydryl oxidase [Mycena venus]